MTEQVMFYNSRTIKEDMIAKLVNTSSPNGSSDEKLDGSRTNQNNEDSETEPNTPVRRKKKRLQQFSESNSESADEICKYIDSKVESASNSEEDTTILRIGSKQHKSRIRTMSSSDDDLKEKTGVTKGMYDLSRVKNKKKQLRDKFHNLASKQEKSKYFTMEIHPDEESHVKGSDNSDEELVTCKKIKERVKKKKVMKISSICDPDTSDDEDTSMTKQNKQLTMKSTKLISPKPIRISAKQAMENMQKIKSESSRMLREKEVSLPYHKAKALTLKDIMSRRKPALAPDGKTLSVKMTAEQLQQYALQLEQRQKEIMELCKSDTEDDDKESKEDREIEKTDQITNVVNQEDKIITESEINTTMGIETKINENTNEIDSETLYSKNLERGDKNLNIDISNSEKNNELETVPEEEKMNGIDINNGTDTNITNAIKSDLNKENKTQNDSQMLELEYDSEKIDCMHELNKNDIVETSDTNDPEKDDLNGKDRVNSEFPENDISFDEIDKIIETFEVKDESGKQTTEMHSLKTKPKLMGTPGMLIDLDNNIGNEKRLSGVELLKERFQYFSKLKSLEDQEKDREKKYKPGVQHLKLKQELEEQIAEQRSIEWAKRLEQEKQQHLELHAIRGDESDADDIEKMEAKMEKLNNSNVSNSDSSESAEDDFEEDCIVKDKPRSRNPMIDDEAQESDIEEDNDNCLNTIEKETEGIEDNEDCDASDEDSSDEETSESDREEISKPKKGRILKAFEDSDDEDCATTSQNKDSSVDNYPNDTESEKVLNISGTQDEELQLAQVPKTTSEDIMVSQDLAPITFDNFQKTNEDKEKDLGSQTFSIINSQNGLNCLEKLIIGKETNSTGNGNFGGKNLFMESFSQNIDSQQETSSLTESQEIGADVVALCTGKFYDNPFVSQVEDNSQNEDKIDSSLTSKEDNVIDASVEQDVRNQEKIVLSSILEELGEPEYEVPKQYKYFVNDSATGNKENLQNVANSAVKKKFTIDSDDETNQENVVETLSKKKSKKRKLEKRTLQFSDDDDDIEEDIEGAEILESDIENDPERIVEYDSEENEVEIQPQKVKKKGGDFFEQEAELTSEDEWIGSGDENEAGLDYMEREEGDDEVFHEGKLRKELGQIHMRDVLDQDKREVRLLQELLFEDGDLGDGHRQRKFRWRNADDAEDTGAAFDEFAEAQEEEFESEEQWRKQRHEREVFLRKMKGNDEELHNSTINRTTIIKANLCSRTMSSLLSETNTSASEKTEQSVAHEKKTHRDIPSPTKKAFPSFHQNCHGSLLSRGKGALARLAAIATPLAGDGDSGPKASAPTNGRNFVFAALTPDQAPKVSKRKADTSSASPISVKKLKTEEKQKHLRSSLFDYLEV